MNSDFYTLKGFQLNEDAEVTSAMEDYLEMICRMSQKNGFARISELAKRLNVKPSSASKMVSNLKQSGFVDYQKYGYIRPTQKGLEFGKYLLYRHDTLNRFLCMINNTQNETVQAEKIEHFLDKRTVLNISKFMDKINKQDL